MREHYPRQCEICDQVVRSRGPWCQLYGGDGALPCWSVAHERLIDADSHGDGPLVNALCNYGRKRFGECLHW